ncbi:hypothetical protein ASG51_19850 [Methylobacterium sp. Leaf465]|nr:hypothetical protein ASG51_19850 [Methylobacterium sp. Leaf465]
MLLKGFSYAMIAAFAGPLLIGHPNPTGHPEETPMLLKGFSYAMIAAFAGGLVFTLVGSAQTFLNL